MSSSTVSTRVQPDTLQKAVGAGILGFGVAGLLAPNLLAKAYGVRDPSPEYTLMARLWGSRNLVVGSVAMAVEAGAPRRSLFTAAAAMNVVDATSALTAKEMPTATRILVVLSSLGFAVASVGVLAGED